MRQAEKLLKTEISTGSVSLLGYPPSAYLTQLVTRVLATRSAIDDATRSQILDWSWRELDHQLALLHANSKNADVFQLAYCMILVSDVGDPGEATPEQSLILQTALDVFFEKQLPDGSLAAKPATVSLSWCRERLLLRVRVACPNVAQSKPTKPVAKIPPKTSTGSIVPR